MSVQRVLLCILSLLAMSIALENCTEENSYLWKVDTEPPLYLFGTMHVPYTQLWEHIPGNVKTAFSSCEDLCLELQLSDQGTREELAKCQLLPGGVDSIEEVLSQETVNRIEQYFASVKKVFPSWLNQGSSILGGSSSDSIFNAITSDWKKKRPIWILILISSLTEEQIQNRNVPVLDLFLDNVAQGLGKQVEAMETPRDQCRPLNKITNEKVELALRVQLDYLEVQMKKNALKNNQKSSIYTYRCGNFAELVSTTPFLPLPPLENITMTSPNLTPNETAALLTVQEHLWNQMVVRRNRKMANAIHTLLQSPRNKTIFIALGAGHFLSDFNVLDRLIKKDHRIEHISAQTTIDGPALPSNTVQLGDPSTQLVNLHPNQEESSSHGLPTLSPDTHERIWNRYEKSAEERPTVQNGKHLTARHSPEATVKVGTLKGESPTFKGSHSSSNSQSGSIPHSSPEDKWSQEISELLYPEQSASGTNSVLYTSQVATILLSALAVISLCLH